MDIIRDEYHTTEPTWITGKPERVLVHKWRAAEQSILVGAGTVRADDPRLNVREWTGRDPIRVILSGSGEIEKGISMANGAVPALVFTHRPGTHIAGSIKIILEDKVPACIQIAQYLFNSDIQSLLIEGGATVLNHFISNGLWDEARIFTGNRNFENGVSAPAIKGTLLSKRVFSGSILETYLNTSDQKTIRIDNLI